MPTENTKYFLLEHYFNRFKFKDIALGGTLADQFILIKSHGLQSIFVILIQFFYEFFDLVFNVFIKNRPILNTPLICTYISNKAHFANMMNPIVFHFANRLTIIAPKKFTPDFEHANFVSIKSTYKPCTNDIFIIVLTSLNFYFALIKKRKRLGLNFNEILFFSVRIFHQCKIISFYHYQFEKSKSIIKLIVTEFDRNSVAAPLILTAKKFNITTVTLVHGTINNYGYVPVLADFIFCHGNVQRGQLLASKVPESKIVTTGTSIISEIKYDEKILSAGEIKMRICVGISPISKTDNEFLISQCIEAIRQFPNCELIIKLHPSQKKSSFIHYQDSLLNVQVVASNDIDNYQLFQMIDLLIINNSGLGIEAALNNVPIAIFDIPGVKLGMGNILVTMGGFPLLNNSKDLSKLIIKMLGNSVYVSQMKQDAKSFARNYYLATGEEAGKNVINNIEQLIAIIE